MQCFSLPPNVKMAAQDDDDFGMFLAYSPTIASLAPSLLPLSDTPLHLRNISSAGVGLASIPPQQQQQRRYKTYKRTPPTGPLLSSTNASSPYSGRRASSMSVMEHPLHWRDGCGFILSISYHASFIIQRLVIIPLSGDKEEEGEEEEHHREQAPDAALRPLTCLIWWTLSLLTRKTLSVCAQWHAQRSLRKSNLWGAIVLAAQITFLLSSWKWLRKFTNILNNCISKQVFPRQWKIARISPIPKVKGQIKEWSQTYFHTTRTVKGIRASRFEAESWLPL